MIFPTDYRPFVDPVELFSGAGWGLLLPPLVFAVALGYHALREDDDFSHWDVVKKAAWLTAKALVFFSLMGLLLWAW